MVKHELLIDIDSNFLTTLSDIFDSFFFTSILVVFYLKMASNFNFIDEPASYGTRFRYVSEGTCHGPVLGQSSIQGNKTHPSISCNGMFKDGHEAILLVSLVSDVSRVPLTYGMHGHTFFGRNVYNGQYIVDLKATNYKFSHQLQGVTVIHTKAADKNDILTGKCIQDMILYRTGIFEYSRLMQTYNSTSTTKQLNIEWLKSEFSEFIADSRILASSVQYLPNQVRLKFDLFIQDENTGLFSNPPKTILSQVVHNTRDKEHKPLHIRRCSRTSGSHVGGDEVFLFCEEFIAKDLEIVFFIGDFPGRIIGHGIFSPTDIYKGGIVFKTPCLEHIISDNLHTNFCLKRGEMLSNSFGFVYYPPVQQVESNYSFDPNFHQFKPINWHLNSNSSTSQVALNDTLDHHHVSQPQLFTRDSHEMHVENYTPTLNPNDDAHYLYHPQAMNNNNTILSNQFSPDQDPPSQELANPLYHNLEPERDILLPSQYQF